jgi:hypothetical protein
MIGGPTYVHHDPVETVHVALHDGTSCTRSDKHTCPAMQAAMRAVVAYRAWQGTPRHPFKVMGWGPTGEEVFHLQVGDGLALAMHPTTADILQHLPYRDVPKADVSLPYDLASLKIITKNTIPPSQMILLPPPRETEPDSES